MDTTPTREEMDARFALVDEKFERFQAQTNARFDRIEETLKGLVAEFRLFRVEQAEVRAEIERVRAEIERVRAEIERVRAEMHKSTVDILKWTIGVMLTLAFASASIVVRVVG